MIVTQGTTAGTERTQPLGSAERFTYGQAPLLIYWEATRACQLACLHCRAEALDHRHPLELKTEEIKQLLREIAAFGGHRLPHLIITGGDPLRRPDLFELIRYGRNLNIPISVTPAGTPRLTKTIIRRLHGLDIAGLGLSLDGSDAGRHDAFRGEAGSFGWTVRAAEAAREIGLPVQVNTMVTGQTVDDIPNIYDVVASLGISRWALFFLIATGRGDQLEELTPAECERFLQWLWRRVPEAPFPIKTTEAHHYRRIAWLKMRRQGMAPDDILQSPVGRGFGIRDGNGIVFVSHIGQIFPSGFLPLAAGNVRYHSLVNIYRESNLFRALRQPDQLLGKCGRCEYRALCGGSRARAYAATGHPLGSDPLCPYRPRRQQPIAERL